MLLDKSVADKLLSYQKEDVINMMQIITKNGAILNASDTGTGKTYTSIAVCAQMKYTPIIICPKSVISTWTDVCKYFDIKPFFIVNYETIKLLKYYVNRKRKECPYISYYETEEKSGYKWTLPKKKLIFIFDEVHRCANYDSDNGKLLIAAKENSVVTNIPILLLTATIADRPERFRLFFYILNFIDPKTVSEKKLSFKQYMIIVDKWIMREQNPMIRINAMLYPDRASRIKIDVLGDLFPETQITATPYNIGQKREAEIEREYQTIAEELEKLKNKEKKDKSSNILVKVMRSQQKIELLKIPIFLELANDFLDSGHSVVIFVNFTQTLEKLAELLHTSCLVYGGQTEDVRQANIKSFQNNIDKVIILNIKAGSVGLSLHDIKGGHPRVSLISPTYNSIDLVQALGRVHRAGGKTRSLQRIIYVANTVEHRIADKLKKKLSNINSINNGDVDLTNVVFEKNKRIK